MASKPIIVRLRSKEGTFRVEALPEDSIATLKQKATAELAKKDITNVQSIKLLHRDNLLEDAKTLKDSRIQHGEMLEMSFSGSVPASSSSSSSSTPSSSSSSSSSFSSSSSKSAASSKQPAYTPPKRKPRVPCPNHGPKGSCVKCLSRDIIRIKQQEKPTISGVSFAHKAAEMFQEYVRDFGFSVQRVGILYGNVDEAGWVNVEVIFEPSQEATANNCLVISTPQDEALVDSLAGLLGLERVGFIVAHTNSEVTLSSGELMQAVELLKKTQAKNFVAVTVSLGEEGATQFEAFQISDQFIELYDDEHFLPPEEPKFVKFKEPVFVGPKETTNVESDFFLTPISIKDHAGELTKGFPVENRQLPQDQAALKRFLSERKNKAYVERIADFHLLYFLTQFLGITEVQPLAEAVRTKDNITPSILVNELAGL
eukprot:TRINITY_DN8870_c0_g1_i1.p1 TRINITY_DN8870_c0_g1~~TRINITY_DN8870_c0_g1_i1.p1  ORF type:complete len:428 (+),score=105.28 TRINITY_DN8870_c0_g1_i1:111-1394(+)